MNKTFMNRPVIKSIIIEAKGTFSAFYEAQSLLKEEGYTVGSMCRDEPIGFADGEKYDYVSKWYNMNGDEKLLLDGVMISDDFREGGVEILYLK
jgi:hypothetical protein